MSLPRVEILIRTRRFDDAERALHETLRENPDDPRAHLLLAHCLLEKKDHPRARRELEEAIRLDSDEATPFLLLASIEEIDGNAEAAVDALMEARRLAPTWSEPLAALARREARRENWKPCLSLAEQALVLDPESQAAGGLRALALTHLGRAGEAADAAERGLQQDPHAPDAHAVRGMTRLHAGKPREAEAAFLEALRLEPGHEGAAAGLVMSLKRRSLVLRPIFGFFLWMQRMPPGLRTGLIVGAWLLYQALRQLSFAYPPLYPFILPLLVVYVVFCVLTWIADPLMNLTLRLHPVGRHALDREQRLSGTLFGIATALSLLAVAGSFTTLPGAESLLVVALAMFLAGVFASWGIGYPRGGHRRVLLVCAGTLAGSALVIAVGSALGWKPLAGLAVIAAAAAAITGFVTPLTRNLRRK